MKLQARPDVDALKAFLAATAGEKKQPVEKKVTGLLEGLFKKK